MNIIDRSHNMPNNGMGKSSWNFRLFTHSKIMNGSTSTKLMIAGDLRFVKIFFMGIFHTISEANLVVKILKTQLPNSSLLGNCVGGDGGN
jgi:hypothetical protein